MSLKMFLEFEAHQEVEREYCWYVTLDQPPTELIKQLKEEYTPIYQVQSIIKSATGSVRVRSEGGGVDDIKFTSTVKQFLPKKDDNIPSSVETTIDVDEDYFKAFLGAVNEAMFKIRFKIPYSDKAGSFWEVDIFTDSGFNPTIYVKIDLETSDTIDDQTVVLPVSGKVIPASPENKALTNEINERIMVKGKGLVK